MRGRAGKGGASFGLAVQGGAVVVFVGLVFGLHAAGYRINLSVSYPLGVFCVVDLQPAAGFYALFCALGPLAGMPPVDQTHVPPYTRDLRCYHVLKRINQFEPSGAHVLVNHPQSLDSQIVGPLDREYIVGVAMRDGRSDGRKFTG